MTEGHWTTLHSVEPGQAVRLHGVVMEQSEAGDTTVWMPGIGIFHYGVLPGEVEAQEINADALVAQYRRETGRE